MKDLTKGLVQPWNKAYYPDYENDPSGYLENVLRIRMTPDQKNIVAALLQHKRVLVRSCHSSGKCSHPDRDVYLSNGSRIKSKNLVKKWFNIFTITPEGIKEVKAYADWNKVEQTYRVTSQSGKYVDCNELHPFYTLKGWKQLKDLYEGELISVVDKLEGFGSNILDREEIDCLGHIYFNVFKSNGELMIKESGVDSEYSYKSIQNIFDTHKISNTFITRELSSKIIECDKESLKQFMNNLFKNCSLYPIINEDECKLKISHRSEKLIRDIAFILLKFGINYRIYKKESRPFWCLSIIDVKEAIECFDIEGEFVDLFYKINPINRDSRWRNEKSPLNTHWEKITSIKPFEVVKTVAIHVPVYETYLGDFYEHNSYIAAGLVNWNYDSLSESISLTAAPNENSILQVMWREIRNHREKIPAEMRDLMEKAPQMQNSPNHFAAGLVGSSGGSITGRKSFRNFVVMDECVDIPSFIWEAVEGLLIKETAMLLALCNPVDPTCYAKTLEDEEGIHVMSISALNHPNILADLISGKDPSLRPYPSIELNLTWVEERLQKWCRRLENVEDRRSYDIEWPPKVVEYEGKEYEIEGEQVIYRPRPDKEFEPRVLGRWPTNTESGIWSEALWENCLSFPRKEPDLMIEIGCDPSYGGKDACSIVVVRGNIVLDHFKYHDLDSGMIAEKLKEIATEFAGPRGITAEDVPIKIDITGSDGVLSHADEWNFIGVNSSESAMEDKKYTKKRSELWFYARDLAEAAIELPNGRKAGGIDLSRLKESSRKSIKKQLLAARFWPRAGGRKDIEQKADIQKRIKESPDDADAFNLAFYPLYGNSLKTVFSKRAVNRINKLSGSRSRR